MKKEGKKTTKSQEKMFAYLCSLASDMDFIDGVSEIRKNFQLPIGGFDKDFADELEYVNNIPNYVDKNGEETEFQKAIYDLAPHFGITLAWLDTLTEYVLYNDFFFNKVIPLVQTIDISDILHEEDASSDDISKEEQTYSTLEKVNISFPVAIFISPYATSRDIIDYIRKQYKKEIQPLQLKYKENWVKIGKVRKRNQDIQERDTFICKHKNLPIKELMRLINKKYGVIMDYTYINKIISKKCKKENK